MPGARSFLDQRVRPTHIERHDPFRLNDRHRSHKSPLPIRSDSTSAVVPDRPAPSTGQAEIDGPSASKRTGWSDETIRLESDSRRLDQLPADRTCHPQRRDPHRPSKGGIDQCHPQCFRRIEPRRESVIDSFLPNDSACFSDLAPDAIRPVPSVVESVWTARTFTFQPLHPSCRARPGTTSLLYDRLGGSARVSVCGEEQAGLGFGGTAPTLDLSPGAAGTNASRRHERQRPL